jgi:hypothetical protein
MDKLTCRNILKIGKTPGYINPKQWKANHALPFPVMGVSLCVHSKVSSSQSKWFTILILIAAHSGATGTNYFISFSNFNVSSLDNGAERKTRAKMAYRHLDCELGFDMTLRSVSLPTYFRSFPFYIFSKGPISFSSDSWSVTKKTKNHFLNLFILVPAVTSRHCFLNYPKFLLQLFGLFQRCF